MLFAAAFFSYSETAAAIFIIGCNYSIKVYFFKQNLHSAANLPISPAPSTLNARTLLIFCEKYFFLLQDNCFFGTI